MGEFENFEDSYLPARVGASREYFVAISGCSGGGKSSLLLELARRGYRVFAEPGRQIVKEQNYIGADGIPSKDGRKFAELCLSRSMHDMIASAATSTHVFFDRSIIDSYNGLEQLPGGAPLHFRKAVESFRYNRKVFITPPWPEIFANDSERTHGYQDAVAEYDTLLPAYRRLGYETIVIPRMSIKERVDFILKELGV